MSTGRRSSSHIASSSSKSSIRSRRSADEPVVARAGLAPVEQDRARAARAHQLAVRRSSRCRCSAPIGAPHSSQRSSCASRSCVGLPGDRLEAVDGSVAPHAPDQAGDVQVARISAAARASTGAPRGAAASSASIRSTSGAALWIASSIAGFSVIADDGQPLQLPWSCSRTTPSSTPSSSHVAAVRVEVRAHLLQRPLDPRRERHGVQPVQQQQVRRPARRRRARRARRRARPTIRAQPLAVEVQQGLHQLGRPRVAAVELARAPTCSMRSIAAASH